VRQRSAGAAGLCATEAHRQQFWGLTTQKVSERGKAERGSSG
jgi:hypothetical protein